ncbi:MAG TPA: homocysteine S-methyltransferase family protein [Euzebyales bacterium]
MRDDAVLLLDGGMGQELFRRGVAASDRLWGARALLDAPEVVREIHTAYLEAGADVITTNTYSTSQPALEQSGVAEKFASLNETAGRLAVEARDAHGRDVLIAGSLPPLGGSYRPDQVGDDLWMVDNYRRMAEALAPFVDLLIAETLSTSAEARAAASAAVSVARPIWIGWTVDADGVLLGGETVTEAANGMKVHGVLANCAPTEAVSHAMPEVIATGAERVGGYANGFTGTADGLDIETVGLDELGERPDLSPSSYADVVRSWLDLGATLVGGCCDIGPAHIAALRDTIDDPAA